MFHYGYGCAVTHVKTLKVKKIETVLCAAAGSACHQRGLEAGRFSSMYEKKIKLC